MIDFRCRPLAAAICSPAAAAMRAKLRGPGPDCEFMRLAQPAGASEDCL